MSVEKKEGVQSNLNEGFILNVKAGCEIYKHWNLD
jgi:hypothetical protein